jgi:Raf kinase inhibitor-like YbhB/YbcL family protein
MKWQALIPVASSFLMVFVLLSGCTGPSPDSPANGTGDDHGALSLRVDALAPGSMLPAEYSCAGVGISPPVSWTGVPAGTQSLVLVIDDPDAPRGGFTHWIVYNLTPDSPGIAANASSGGNVPGGGYQGLNSLGRIGYVPVCPPNGNTHRYVFQLYALDTTISGPVPDRTAISEALAGHTLEEAQGVMMFGR